MSGDFYTVLLFSLLLTAGGISIYFGYRYLVARMGVRKSAYSYVELRNLEKGTAKGEIIFYFSVPEPMHVRLEITDLDDNVIKIVEDKDFGLGDFRIPFVSTHFADGDYFYRIITDHQQTAKKFSINNAQ
jgi:hypothetical protein